MVMSEAVQIAKARGKPIVALESTIITHGMQYPINKDTALAVEKAVRDNGAVPATIAIIQGIIHIGLSAADIDFLAQNGETC